MKIIAFVLVQIAEKRECFLKQEKNYNIFNRKDFQLWSNGLF